MTGKTKIYIGTLASNVFIQACTILQAVVLARFLGPNGRGELAAIILWPAVFASIGILGVNMAIARHAGRGTAARSLSKTAVYAALVTSFIAVVLCGLFVQFLIPTSKHILLPAIYIYLMMIPLNHISANLAAIDQGEGNFGWLNFSRIIIYPIYFTGLLICWKSQPVDKVYWVVVALLTANCGVVACRLFSRLADLKVHSSPSVKVITVIEEGLPFLASNATSEIYMQLDKAILIWLLPAKEIGWYFAAMSASGCVNVLSTALGIIQFSTAVRGTMRLGFCELARALRRGAVLSIFVASGLFLVLPWAMPLVYGADFNSAILTATILLPGLILTGISGIISQALSGQGKPLAGILPRLMALGVMGVLGVALSVFGANGVAFAYVAGEFIVFAGLLRTSLRHYDDSTWRDLLPRFEDATFMINKITGR